MLKYIILMSKKILWNLKLLDEWYSEKVYGKRYDVHIADAPITIVGAIIAVYLYPKYASTTFLDYLPSIYTIIMMGLVSASLTKIKK